MYGKLDKDGNLVLYNGYSIDYEGHTITNPGETDLILAGYKPVVGNGYIINTTTSKLTVTYTEKDDCILVVHSTEDGYMGELPNYDEEYD